jgi:hypothetical protein
MIESKYDNFRCLLIIFIRFILHKNGTIKSDDESRVSIKSAVLTCLSYLSTLDPFAFFDAWDYPSESKIRSENESNLI